MPSLPTQRTLAYCRKRGWRVAVVEKWIPQTKRRIDLFGFGDLLALDGQPGSLLIQACAGGGAPAKRVAKILDADHCEAACDWLAAGNRLEVWGWRKAGPKGKRKLWQVRRVAIVLDGPFLESREVEDG